MWLGRAWQVSQAIEKLLFEVVVPCTNQLYTPFYFVKSTTFSNILALKRFKPTVIHLPAWRISK